MSISGDTVVIGSRADDGLYDDPGKAYVFTRTAGVWTEQATLAASDGVRGFHFGYSVSVSGDTAVIGSEGDNHAGTYTGSAYVFSRTAGVWAEQAKLTASDAAHWDRFGESVSVSGDTAVIGATRDTDVGSAYVYTRISGVWTERAKLTASDSAADESFGCFVSVNSDTAVIGASSSDTDGGEDAGSAFVFAGILTTIFSDDFEIGDTSAWD